MKNQKIGAVVRVSLGNFLEMYDFMVFGYYAAAIGRAFFPTQNEYASLMLSFMTFGTGYLMRPLGAVVLGAYIDHHGRRKGLLLTLSLMAVGTISIGIMPGYERIGLFAPLLVVAGRLLQGLSAGRSEEHTSELQSPCNLVCRLLLEKKKKTVIRLSCTLASDVSIYETGGIAPVMLATK